MTMLTCLHVLKSGDPCGNTWRPRTDKPTLCPRCKSKDWAGSPDKAKGQLLLDVLAAARKACDPGQSVFFLKDAIAAYDEANTPPNRRKST